MYYPTGWHRVLRLDIGESDTNEAQSKILQVQGNHERELFFILTSHSLHIWFPKPTVEIVCHRRSTESIKTIGLNKSAIWKTDSSTIVVSTDRDQLLFYQIKKRNSSSQATSFLLPASLNGGDVIYRLKHDQKNIKKLPNGRALPDNHESESVPALTMFSFGKLDLSTVGISCLMAAEEELVIGARNGCMYGILWDGNVDDEFPWALSKEVHDRADYLVDLKFSSILAGFALVFESGRVGFMSTNLRDQATNKGQLANNANINYLPNVTNAVLVEINHRNRLVAIGLHSSKVLICNIGEDNSTLVFNHILELDASKIPHDPSRMGPIKSMSYSPDNAALVVSWTGGDFAIWSMFGSLLYCSQQWQQECDNCLPVKPVIVSSLAWGREGYNLWLCCQLDLLDSDTDIPTHFDSMSISLDGEQSTSSSSGAISKGIVPSSGSRMLNEIRNSQREQVLLMPLARCNLSCSPHSTCSSDSIVLMTEEKIYVGPSVPQKDNFDHWVVVDIAQNYLRSQQPIRYASVDRDCKNLVVAGVRGLAIFCIESNSWRLLTKKGNGNSFTVCGDAIWWQCHLLCSCYNFTNHKFELRAYSIPADQDTSLDNACVVVQQIPSEIVRMSIFENRLLVLYVDGTLGMFMLNLRKKNLSSHSRRPVSLMLRSNSIVSASGRNTDNSQTNSANLKSGRSNSIVNWNQQQLDSSEVSLHIAPIENLIISNLQANSFCISSIALTRLHFKNNRYDDSILLNACGKLLLLERETPPEHLVCASTPNSPANSTTSPDNVRDLSLDSSGSTNGPDTPSTVSAVDEAIMKVNSPRTLANSVHLASAALKASSSLNGSNALSNVTFKAVSVIATNVEQFWISPEISNASDMSYFRRSLWLLCGHHGSADNPTSSKDVRKTMGSDRQLQVWLPLLNDKSDPPNDLFMPDRIMLPVKCDIYPLAIRSSSSHSNITMQSPDDAIVLGAESDILYKDCKLFTHFPYSSVKRQCRVYLHRILRELLLSQHLGYYAKKIAESCQSLPYFAHCFELLLHEVLEEEATSPVPLPDPMLPQVVRFIKQFPQVYLETVVHCARKSELSMWSHLFDERAVGDPRKLFQECLEKQKLDIAASCLIILQSLDRNIVSSRMVKELMRLVKENKKFEYLIQDLENFLSRAEIDRSLSVSPASNG